MLKKMSLRARLTLLSAMVMLSVSIILTGVSLLSANRIFVQDLGQELLSNPHVFVPNQDILSISDYAGIATFTPNDSSIDGGAENDGVPITDSDYITLKLTLNQAGRRFNLWGIAGFALVTLLGAGATWIIVGRALKPVRELSTAIEEISGQDLSRRVDTPDSQDEIGRLSRSFNRMMDKVSDSFERQKRFSASAAHELKTPLATIQVGMEVLDLDDEPDPERMKKALAVTKANTSRMIRLMDDLFRLSTEEDYEMNDEVQAAELIIEALEELQPLTRKKALTVSTAVPPDVRLTGSRPLLYRAMFNLIENAAKYNREGGSISIAAAPEEDAVIIQISDTGIGIPLEDQGLIYEPFYRVDRSRSRAMGGSGLGLPLVREIISRHGGGIEVESLPGEGTTFKLRLPVKAGGNG